MSEKPVPMLKHFMEMTVDEYSRVLDPTAGSANALKAATALGAPTVLGLERDAEFFARSTAAYFATEGDNDEDLPA
jgi:predicted RNA methylase